MITSGWSGMRAMLACWLALFSALAVAPQAVADDYALLVGIADYHRYRKELERLSYSKNDIIEFASELQKSGYKKANIIVLHEDQKDIHLLPEAKKINEQLDLMLESVKPGDTLLVALAGHGVQFLGETTNYFCPMDAIPAPDRRDTLIAIDSIYERLARCSASHKLLLVDACRNDPLSKLSRSADGVKLASVTRPPVDEVPAGLAAIFSCGEQQKSYEDDTLKHGIFFYNVLQAWKGEADGYTDPPTQADGKLTFTELSHFVKDRTRAHAQKYFQKPQIPVWPSQVQDWVIRQLDSGSSTFVTRGNDLRDQGKFREAKAEYTRAIQNNPRFARAFIGRGLASLALRDFSGAINDFTTAIRTDPASAALAYRCRGSAYGQKGEYENAIEDYSSAIELDPGSADAFVGRGGAHLQTGKLPQALRDLNRAIEINPRLAVAYRNRSLVYERLGDNARAGDDLALSRQLESQRSVPSSSRTP